LNYGFEQKLESYTYPIKTSESKSLIDFFTNNSNLVKQTSASHNISPTCDDFAIISELNFTFEKILLNIKLYQFLMPIKK
jgi:hypothetical protein